MRWGRFGAFSATMLVLCMSILPGCGAKPRVFVGPFEDHAAFHPATLDRLSEVLTAFHGPLETLQTQSSITVDGGRKGKRSFTANLLVALPDKARLRGSRGVLGTLFEVVSAGGQMHVYFNRDGVLFSGSPADLDASAGVLRLIGPDELLRALLAQRDLARSLETPGRLKIQDRLLHWVIRAEGRDGGWQIWVVRKSDFLVEETIVSRRGGQADARIRYWEYRLVEGEPVPFALDIHLAEPRMRVEIGVERVRLNPPLRPEVFVPPAVADDRWHPLGHLHFDPL